MTPHFPSTQAKSIQAAGPLFVFRRSTCESFERRPAASSSITHTSHTTCGCPLAVVPLRAAETVGNITPGCLPCQVNVPRARLLALFRHLHHACASWACAGSRYLCFRSGCLHRLTSRRHQGQEKHPGASG